MFGKKELFEEEGKVEEMVEEFSTLFEEKEELSEEEGEGKKRCYLCNHGI